MDHLWSLDMDWACAVAVVPIYDLFHCGLTARRFGRPPHRSWALLTHFFFFFNAPAYSCDILQKANLQGQKIFISGCQVLGVGRVDGHQRSLRGCFWGDGNIRLISAVFTRLCDSEKCQSLSPRFECGPGTFGWRPVVLTTLGTLTIQLLLIHVLFLPVSPVRGHSCKLLVGWRGVVE